MKKYNFSDYHKLIKYYASKKPKTLFNRKHRSHSKSLYKFNTYLTTFEKSNYKLFVQSYYKLKASQVKYWRVNPI